MAQQGYHGKNATHYCNGYALQSYFRKITLKRSAEAPENTTISLSARTREEDGMLEGSVGGEGVFDDSSGGIDEILESILGAQRSILSTFPGGEAVGRPGYAMVGLEGEYASDNAYDDIITFSNNVDSDNDGDTLSEGLERILCLHPLASRNSDSSGTILDLGAAKDNGGSAYLQVTSFSGTSVVFTIEHSDASDMTGATPLGTFDTVTSAHQGQRITLPSGTGAIKRYVRVTWNVTTATVSFVAGIHIHI